MENKKMIRFLVPALIVVLLAGMYVYKNYLKPSDVADVTPPATGSESVATETTDPNTTPATGETTAVELSGKDMPMSADYDLEGWLAQGKPVLIEFGTES